MKLKATPGYVLVKRIKEEKSKGFNMGNDSRVNGFVVISCGDRDSVIKKGDIVYYIENPMAITVNGEEMPVLDIGKIVAREIK